MKRAKNAGEIVIRVHRLSTIRLEEFPAGFNDTYLATSADKLKVHEKAFKGQAKSHTTS